MTVALETRLATLERDVHVLDTELRGLRTAMTSHVTVQESHHSENSLRLTKIEHALVEIAVYFKLGRWVMYAVWTLIGGAAAVVLTKWLGTAKP